MPAETSPPDPQLDSAAYVALGMAIAFTDPGPATLTEPDAPADPAPGRNPGPRPGDGPQDATQDPGGGT